MELASIFLVAIVSFIVMILDYKSSVLQSFHLGRCVVLDIVVHFVSLQVLDVFVTSFLYLLVL